MDLGERLGELRDPLELGLPQHSVERAIGDALVWFAREGHIKDADLRRRILGRLE